MVGYRRKRVADSIKRELAELIQRDVHDSRLEQVSITDVEMSPDLRNARVYFSMIGDDDRVKEASLAFERASGYFRKELATRVRLRYTPQLTFHFDDSLEEGEHIERLLRQIAEEEQAGESAQ
jgi:ribosome-binding factor A